MKITFEFPDDAWDGIINSFAEDYHRPETIRDDIRTSPNPESKDAFAIRKVQEYIAEIWGNWERRQNLKAVTSQVDSAIEARKIEVAAATTVKVEL